MRTLVDLTLTSVFLGDLKLDTSLTELRRTLHAKLRDTGYRLDGTRDPDEMKALISQRKRLQASLAVTEATLTRVMVNRIVNP
jgi:hypothetical protein